MADHKEMSTTHLNPNFNEGQQLTSGNKAENKNNFTFTPCMFYNATDS